jgi:O-antigen ligase
VFGFLVAIGWVRGVTSGGSFTDSLLELRPWLYLVITYFVSSQLLTSKKHLQWLVWLLAIGIGIKAVQGAVSLALHYSFRPQAILYHEESLFFGVFIAVLAALWLVPIKGRLRTFMTIGLPFVLATDVANQRRTSWAITGAVLVTVFILCYAGLPERRRAIAGFAAVGCVLAGVYWVGFSNNPGFMGQPARAVLSQLAPSSRDQQSNQYRTVENVNLGIAIRQTMPFGMGFGHQIPQAVPNVDVSNVDSFISYLPHNGVLYVWLRLGLAGIVCFWLLIGLAIMTAVNTFRRPRSQLAQLISITLVVAVVAYVTQGFFDMGLYWFRIAVAIGFLMGALEAVRRFDQEPAPESPPLLTSQASARGVAIAKRHAA